MGKRSEFKRLARDFYPTPKEAIKPLMPHLDQGLKFDEPCAGNGKMAEHIESLSGFTISNTGWSDIEPENPIIPNLDLFNLYKCRGDMFITNPPWPSIGKHGDPTISMAIHLSDLAPTWFLLNADVMHNKYFTKVADRCAKVVSVGRVSWAGNGIKGKENCAWFLFMPPTRPWQTTFYGRVI